MTAKAYQIDAAAREIREVEWDDTGIVDIRRFLNCGDSGFGVGWMFAGEPVYIDDKGLLKPSRHFFQVINFDVRGGASTPLAGNGLYTGRDLYKPNGDSAGAAPPRMSIEEFREKIRFLSRAQADAWSVIHAKESCTSINGQTVQTWEQFWREVPIPEGLPNVVLRLDGPDGTTNVAFPTVWDAIDRARLLRDFRPLGAWKHGALISPDLTVLLTADDITRVLA